jgi:multiple sugar transport system substrate-binding protein
MSLLRSLCALAVVACLGCGSNPDGLTEIRYMAWGNPQQLAVERQLCDEFERLNPDLKVKFVQVPSSAYQNKMTVMLASRTAPDVMRIDNYVFPSLVRKNYFYPLDELIALDPEFSLEAYLESAVEECRHEGKLYAMNVLFGSQVIYYNKDLMRAAGLDDPYELSRRGEWTWERFLSHAKAITKFDANGRPEIFGAHISGLPPHLAVLYSFGGDIMDDQRTRVVMAEGKAAEAWQFIRDLRFKHRVMPTPSQSANSLFSFDSGKVGMTIDWMGMTPRLRDTATFDWDVCPLPMKPGGTTVIKGNQLAIYRESRNPDAAWRFVKFMTGDHAERLLYIDLRRSFPTRNELAFGPDFLESKQPPFNMDAFVESVKAGRQLPITSRWNEWTGEFNSGIDDILSGRSDDVQAALREAQSRANRVLAVREGL